MLPPCFSLLSRDAIFRFSLSAAFADCAQYDFISMRDIDAAANGARSVATLHDARVPVPRMR